MTSGEDDSAEKSDPLPGAVEANPGVLSAGVPAHPHTRRVDDRQVVVGIVTIVTAGVHIAEERVVPLPKGTDPRGGLSARGTGKPRRFVASEQAYAGLLVTAAAARSQSAVVEPKPYS
jgi:hypothetical protein